MSTQTKITWDDLKYVRPEMFIIGFINYGSRNFISTVNLIIISITNISSSFSSTLTSSSLSETEVSSLTSETFLFNLISFHQIWESLSTSLELPSWLSFPSTIVVSPSFFLESYFVKNAWVNVEWKTRRVEKNQNV